jgi:ADP-heptose:LPS heptosyltransferase
MGSNCCKGSNDQGSEITQDQAATKIQAKWRGNQARKKYKSRKKESHHFPKDCAQVDKMLQMNAESKQTYERLGKFDYDKYPLSKDQEAELKKYPTGGPFQMLDSTYEGQFFEGKR